MKKIIRFKTASSCCADSLMKQIADLLNLGYQTCGPTSFTNKGNGIVEYVQMMSKEEPVKRRKIRGKI